ncbi:hypothetical protein DGWBC_0761 [Dehalogenimonas sp. WBC-2]|nr:hypothetical protein DGWBC_0761 [Dehalogenimonas sp. WBC-2]
MGICVKTIRYFPFALWELKFFYYFFRVIWNSLSTYMTSAYNNMASTFVNMLK